MFCKNNCFQYFINKKKKTYHQHNFSAVYKKFEYLEVFLALSPTYEFPRCCDKKSSSFQEPYKELRPRIAGIACTVLYEQPIL